LFLLSHNLAVQNKNREVIPWKLQEFAKESSVDVFTERTCKKRRRNLVNEKHRENFLTALFKTVTQTKYISRLTPVHLFPKGSSYVKMTLKPVKGSALHSNFQK